MAALTAVTAQWREHIGLQREVTVQQVINYSVNAHDFFVALMNVAAAKSGNVISNDRLGRWLKKNEARIVSSVSLRCTGVSHGHSTWKLVRLPWWTLNPIFNQTRETVRERRVTVYI